MNRESIINIFSSISKFSYKADNIVSLLFTSNFSSYVYSFQSVSCDVDKLFTCKVKCQYCIFVCVSLDGTTMHFYL